MAYFKQVLVLKEVTRGYSVTGKKISGIVNVEADGNIITVNADFIDLCSVTAGEYLFKVRIGDHVYGGSLGNSAGGLSCSFDLKSNLDGALKADFLLLHDEEDGKTLVGFADGIKKYSASYYSDAFCQAKELKEEVEPKKDKTPLDGVKNLAYNDEAIATENYYETDGSDKNSDTFMGLFDQDAEVNDVRQADGDKNVDFKEEFQAKTQKESVKPYVFSNEAELESIKDGETYYNKIKNELDGLFSSCPQNYSLTASVPNGKFVDVTDKSGEVFAVGVISEEDTPKYLCYGLPSKYAPVPPDSLVGYATFMPISLYDLSGDGYWMIFQDAVTGECIRIENV